MCCYKTKINLKTDLCELEDQTAGKGFVCRTKFVFAIFFLLITDNFQYDSSVMDS